MKIRHILILALAACTVTAATAQKKSGKSKKAKTEKTVKTTKMTPAKVQPVPAAEFSYAIGVLLPSAPGCCAEASNTSPFSRRPS